MPNRSEATQRHVGGPVHLATITRKGFRQVEHPETSAMIERHADLLDRLLGPAVNGRLDRLQTFGEIASPLRLHA